MADSFLFAIRMIKEQPCYVQGSRLLHKTVLIKSMNGMQTHSVLHFIRASKKKTGKLNNWGANLVNNDEHKEAISHTHISLRVHQ